MPSNLYLVSLIFLKEKVIVSFYIFDSYIQELSKEVTGAPGKIVARKCDISKEEQILALYDNIKTEYGGAEVCVNNAGLSHNSPLLNGLTEDWRETMKVTFTCVHVLYMQLVLMTLQVNLLAACIMTREFVKQLKERNSNVGHIIMIGRLAIQVYSKVLI